MKRSLWKNASWIFIFLTLILAEKSTSLSNYSRFLVKKKHKRVHIMSPPSSSLTSLPNKKSIQVAKLKILVHLKLSLIYSLKRLAITCRKLWSKPKRKNKKHNQKRNPFRMLWRTPPLKLVQSKRKDSRDLENNHPLLPNFDRPLKRKKKKNKNQKSQIKATSLNRQLERYNRSKLLQDQT